MIYKSPQSFLGSFQSTGLSVPKEKFTIDFQDGGPGDNMDIWLKPFQLFLFYNKGKRKVQGVPQTQAAALPRHLKEEKTDKTNQAQIEQMYQKHKD